MIRVMVGIVAKRDPKSGEFIEPEPIYKEFDNSVTVGESMFNHAGKLFGELMQNDIRREVVS